MVAFIFSAMTFTMHVSRHHAFACYTPFCLTAEGVEVRSGDAGDVLSLNMSFIKQKTEESVRFTLPGSKTGGGQTFFDWWPQWVPKCARGAGAAADANASWDVEKM